jgi:hypothetical protein
MIGHQAKSNDAMTKPLDAFLKEKTKPATVFIIKKDVLSGVATKGDMVQGTGIMNAGFTGHKTKIALNFHLAILQA